ncbi:MAG: hypothetical protein ABI453_13975 [Isosphaeraceae bacterium]
MSNLTGHSRITAKAVEELILEEAKNPLLKNLDAADLPTSVVMRDLRDLSGGHWADYGQKHHFMRKFDGQSPFEAYQDAVEWIKSNALDASARLARRIRRYNVQKGATSTIKDARGRSVLGGTTVQTLEGPQTLDRPDWQHFGNAVHALQDSFSKGHVTREDSSRHPYTPGAIAHIKRYAGDEKQGHAHADEGWWEGKGRNGYFSRDGRFAVNATKSLIRIVFRTATASNGQGASDLSGWSTFQGVWLKASSRLSRQRDQVFDLIDRYYKGARIGANNLKTISMDEEGLANALIREAGTDSNLTLHVFERLDEHYNSDADDVAELYVKGVRARGGAVLDALKSNPKLIQRLIKVMDEGWTSGGEQECIKFLRGLNK